MSEIWVPARSDIIYAAPSLIVHYITAHQYQPPQVYMDAVMEFDMKSEWNAKQEFNRIMEQVSGEH